jgi:signal transduction histidine kinase
MRGVGKTDGNSTSLRCGPACALAAIVVLSCGPLAAAGPEDPKLVVVLFPNESDGAPGISLVNRGLRSTFSSQSSEHIELRNEYVDSARLRDAEFLKAQVSVLGRKYAGRKVDLVIAGMSSALDFALAVRDEVFPGVPVVYLAVDEREVKARRLPPDVIGVPTRMDLEGTLDVALGLHPDTRRVYVIAGTAPFDTEWEAEARRTFRPHEGRVEFVYLTGLPIDELVRQVADLPERSLIYYLHIFRDGAGKPFYPAMALERLAAKANAPIYGHYDTFVDRGAVGGRVLAFDSEGSNAARLGLRILTGEKPETIAVTTKSENIYLFDSRQLRRWGISEESLPPGSVVRFKEPNLWDLYKWHVIGVISLCVIEALLISGLLVQLRNRRRAEYGLRETERELRLQTGRVLMAQETERRRIARDLHDDLNQELALVAVQLDLLCQNLAASSAHLVGKVQQISARVKDVTTSVHDLSHQLHPYKLEHDSLVTAVHNLCWELSQGHGLPIEFVSRDVPQAIPEDTALCVYRIVQEALRNTVKHSGARHSRVELSGTEQKLCLRIVDDGSGFDATLVDGKGGLGFVSMKERLHMVRGEITIDSQPKSGTAIEAHVPLNSGGVGPSRSRAPTVSAADSGELIVPAATRGS